MLTKPDPDFAPPQTGLGPRSAIEVSIVVVRPPAADNVLNTRMGTVYKGDYERLTKAAEEARGFSD
jgi:hypothetical protein